MKPFLTAYWRHLAMLNYVVDPGLLGEFVPAGTELDLWQGRCFVSVVGFLFERTRVAGMVLPFHENFEELNLRFYVRRRAGDGERRGVVFIKEVVPRFWVAKTARWAYNENYVSLPMRHAIVDGSVRYEWKLGGRWNSLVMRTVGEAGIPASGSEEEFITEHYWGYAARRDRRATNEYRVEHPQWKVWRAQEARLDCDAEALYGADLARYLRGEPTSAFLAEGSAISVYRARKLSSSDSAVRLAPTSSE